MASNQNPGLYNGGRPPGPPQGSQNFHGFGQTPQTGIPNHGMRPPMEGHQKGMQLPPSGFPPVGQNPLPPVSQTSGVNGIATPPPVIQGQDAGLPRPGLGAVTRPMMNGPSAGPGPNTSMNQFPPRPTGPGMPPTMPQSQLRPPGPQIGPPPTFNSQGYSSSGAPIRGMGPPQMSGPPRMGMAPITSAQEAFEKAPIQETFGAADRPNELPIPYHGQGQYTHQVGLHLTPGITPSHSAPASQKSSRTSSPSGLGTSQNFDALEGQFSNSFDRSFGDSPAPQDNSMTRPGFPPQPGNVPISSSQQWGPTSPGQPRFQQPGFPPKTGTPPLGQSGLPGHPTPPSVGSVPRFPPPSTTSQQVGFPPPPVSAPQQRFPSPDTSVNQQQVFPPPPTSANQQPRFQTPAPMNQQHGFPPAPVSANQRPGFPPPPTSTNQQPGFPTQVSAPQRPGFPPPPTSANQQPGFPPPPTSANQQPGFPFPPTSANQQPGFPPPPTSTNQRPGFPSQLSNQQPGVPLPNQQGGFPPNSTATGPSGRYPAGVGGQNVYPQPGQQFNQGPVSTSQSQFNAYQGGMSSLSSGIGAMSVQEGSQVVNLLQQKKIIPGDGVPAPKPKLPHEYRKVNCSPECTLNAIPQTTSLLNKARLPLGILIHPFKDLSQLPVIQSSVIVRCRSCRTYINPFVQFVDQKRWKCNLCYRLNELPDEFSFDPVSKTYGDPQRRPEIRSATIEFIAPSEYMLRPPQPAVYLYLLDVSFNARETGYLNIFSQTMLEVLDKIPGDARTQIGFIAYDSAVHFFNLAEGLSQPQMLTVSDVDDIFLPCPDNLLVNLNESKELVIDLLNQLPSLFEDNMETGSALGAALQAGYKMTSGSGGRVTVVQTVLPTVGPGALQNREDATGKAAKDVPNLGPAIDFYKKLALDCSAQQIAVDLFMLNGQYADLASLECISKFSGGCVSYYPSFHVVRAPHLVEKFEVDLRRYLTRKIGFEAVMRIRCSKGLSIHTFHGNFFVRSTDLLSLPNVNPDAGFGMQMSIEENLTDMTTMCFQAALLYTSSKGERRIRVHTLCLPVTNQLNEIYASADQQAIIALVAKMAVDRSVSASMSDAREGIVHAAIDTLNAYGSTLNASQRMGAVPVCDSLRLLPLYCLALLKSPAFRINIPTRLDDRVFALSQCKTQPVTHLLQQLYPSLYPLHTIMDVEEVTRGNTEIPDLPLLQLSSANIDRFGAYLLDAGNVMYLYIGSAINEQFCKDILDKPNFASIVEGGMTDLPELDNPGSERLRNFLTYLLDTRPNGAALIIAREDGKHRLPFFQYFVEDRSESAMSYYEFLQHIQKQVNS